MALLFLRDQFSDLLAEKRPGDTVTLSVQRDGQVQELKLKLPPSTLGVSPLTNPL